MSSGFIKGPRFNGENLFAGNLKKALCEEGPLLLEHPDTAVPGEVPPVVGASVGEISPVQTPLLHPPVHNTSS